jgi:hypothetical protein
MECNALFSFRRFVVEENKNSVHIGIFIVLRVYFISYHSNSVHISRITEESQNVSYGRNMNMLLLRSIQPRCLSLDTVYSTPLKEFGTILLSFLLNHHLLVIPPRLTTALPVDLFCVYAATGS